MATQLAARGPDRAPETIVDRTMVLDPAALWPNSLDCPDWPASASSDRQGVALRGRAAAEARLETLGAHLNRGPGKLRAPTNGEREDFFAKLFLKTGAAWHGLGIHDLSPRDRTVEDDARAIVDAVHIRGYLRKLAAQETQAAEEKTRAEHERAQHTLDSFNQSLTAGRAELTELAESEARHRQRLEDERAFARCNAIRTNLRHDHHPAAQAAARLGVDAPPMPAFFD